MSRYYVLMEWAELKVVEADRVEMPSPMTLAFVSRLARIEFPRLHVLWWKSVDEAPPGPPQRMEMRWPQAGHEGMPGSAPRRGGRTPGSWGIPQPGPQPHQPFGAGHPPGAFPLGMPGPLGLPDVFGMGDAIGPADPFGALWPQTPMARKEAAGEVLRAAVAGIAPKEWKNASLEIKARYEVPECRYKLTHRLWNPETKEEMMDFSDELFAAIDVFHRIAMESGQDWAGCTATFSLQREAVGNGS